MPGQIDNSPLRRRAISCVFAQGKDAPCCVGGVLKASSTSSSHDDAGRTFASSDGPLRYASKSISLSSMTFICRSPKKLRGPLRSSSARISDANCRRRHWRRPGDQRTRRRDKWGNGPERIANDSGDVLSADLGSRDDEHLKADQESPVVGPVRTCNDDGVSLAKRADQG
jgi:hypothetical protein